MLKLVFYSGGDARDNTSLDKRLLKLVEKKSPRIAFIPSCSYDSEMYFQDFVSQYRKYGVKKFLHFPIDVPFDAIMLNEVLKSDIIHLSGGNTFYFLFHLRKAKLLSKLKDFVKRGGILTGLSAGGILMTPDIATAGFPDFDRDDNDEGIKNLKSLKLVDFDFFPHYRNSKRYDQELLSHSKKSKRPLYACPDGSGIILNRGSLEFVGKCYLFVGNKKIRLS